MCRGGGGEGVEALCDQPPLLVGTAGVGRVLEAGRLAGGLLVGGEEGEGGEVLLLLPGAKLPLGGGRLHVSLGTDCCTHADSIDCEVGSRGKKRTYERSYVLPNSYVLQNSYERLYVCLYVLPNSQVHSYVLPNSYVRPYVRSWGCPLISIISFFLIRTPDDEAIYYSTIYPNSRDLGTAE